MNLSSTKKAILALIIANILWGMGPPIFKWSFANVHVFTLAFLRFAIPTILLGILANKQVSVRREDIRKIIVVGLFDITLNILLYFIGILYTESINASIIASASPVFLILGSILFLKEKPSKKMLLGNLIGLTGVLLIVVQPIFQKTVHASVFGNILLVLSAMAAVIGTIFARKIAKEYSAITITFWSFVVGTTTFFPFFVRDVFTYGFLPHIEFQGYFGIVYGALLCSFTAYFIYFWALKYVPASETGVFSYLDPIAGIMIAAPLLGEYPTPFFLFGAFLVFAGIYVAERRINYHPFHKLFRKG